MSSLKAELSIGDEVRNILNVSQAYGRLADTSGNPTTKPTGKPLEFLIESTSNDSFFYENMFSPTAQISGKIIFYSRDGMGVLFKMEFENAHIIGVTESFDALSTIPMQLKITIGWGVMKIRDTVLREYWGNKHAFTQTQVKPTKRSTQEEKTPKITKGWWSNDTKGNKLTEAKLGETVYFHIQTKDIDDGEDIELKLYEEDHLWSFESLNPDDDEFPDKTVTKQAIVNNNKAVVELLLEENWESVIKDDTDYLGNLNHKIELYWQATYNDIAQKLPDYDKDYLYVGFSDRTLYFKTPTPDHKLPEFISNDGDPLIFMGFAKNHVKSLAKKQTLKAATKQANKAITNIALAKLKKGFMVDNKGKVYKGKRLIHEYKKIYSNSGELFEGVEKGKNFTYNYKGVNTTKGISQYDYFSKTGKGVSVLGMVKHLSNIFDIINIAETAKEDIDTSKPIPLDFGPLSPVLDIAGVLVADMKHEDYQFILESVQEEIDLAKLEGLEATRKLAKGWNHNENMKWGLLKISTETANEMIQGKFKTFDELRIFDIENGITTNKFEILYRIIKNPNKENIDVYIIETIFINE